MKSSLKRMNSFVTDESPSSGWNIFWAEKKDRELEIEERLRRKRKIISLVNEEVIQVADEQHTKLQKRALKGHCLIPQVPKILQTNAVTVPEQLQTVSESVLSENEHMSRIFDFNSDNCLSQIPFDVFSNYTDYIQNMCINYPNRPILEYTKSTFAPLKLMPVDLRDAYFKDLAVPNLEIEKKALAVIKTTIPALSFQDPKAPLQNSGTLECDFLNSYIHPLFKECLYEFGGKTGWVSGEIPHEYFIGKTRADGVATMVGRDLPLAYFEGSRPVAAAAKHIADLTKIQANAVAILRQTVVDLTMWKKRVPENLRTFTAQHWNGNISLNVLECYDDVYIHNFDTVQIPKCSADYFMFENLYNAIIGWSVLIDEMATSYEMAETTERRSRKSFAMARYMMANGSQQEQDVV
ncbi:hypothetical protein HDU82_004894 [Entophlyctis luteolus]|nr:hypothetical protein HDU82_004894 [Entophlyctis luteolus]